MITPETPLTEVAEFLEPRTAALMLDSSMELQAMYLHTIRLTLWGWEQEGRALDPITLGEALHGLVVSMLGEGR